MAPPTDDEVVSDQGQGTWAMWVYGYSDAYYNYSGDWYLIANDV